MAKVYNRLAEINKTQTLTSSDNMLVEQGNVVMRVPLPVVAETLGTEIEIEETVTQQVYKNKENIATLDTTMGTKANSTDLTAEVTRAKAAEKTNADNLTQLSLNKGEQSAIANVFDATATYTWDDKVTYQGKAYKCKVQSHSGEWNADDFAEIVVYDELSNYARNDGSYTKMSVGTADNLTSRGDATEETIMSRVAGGDNVIEEGNATIKMLKGNSVVMNQLSPSLESCVSSSCLRATLSYSDGVLTVKGNEENDSHYFRIIANKIGHYYLFFCLAKVSNNGKVAWCGDSLNWKTAVEITGSDEYTTLSFISTPIVESTSTYIAIGNFGVSAVSYYKGISIIDLTQMFGSGNEPASVDEFAKRLGYDSIEQVPYIALNSGELISMKASGIKTCGRNLWDEQWEVGLLNTNNGENVTDNSHIRQKSYTEVVSGQTYFIKRPASTSLYLCYYDANKKFVSSYKSTANEAITIASGVSYLRFCVYADSYGTTYKGDICINISDASFNGQYEPYWTSTRTWADTLNKYFADGLRSAGTAYDEITSTKAIKRIGVVDLGTLDWYLENFQEHIYFQTSTTISDIATNDGNKIANIIASVPYSVSSAYNIKWHNVDNAVGIVNGQVRISDPLYKDVDTFKVYIKGKTLFYELETPEEYTYDELNLSEKVCPNGMEEAVVADDVNSTPIVANMVYGIDSYGTIKSNKSNIATLTTANTSLASALTSMGVGTFTYTNGTWTFTPSNSTASE